MIVKTIKWLSEEAKEAIVEVHDGTHKCTAFSHPCTANEGELLIEPLFAFNAVNLMKVEDVKESIEQVKDELQHKVTGILKSVRSSVVWVGGIRIELEDELPGDLQDGDLIQFTCGRLDLM
jgi:hypothetical protein